MNTSATKSKKIVVLWIFFVLSILSLLVSVVVYSDIIGFALFAGIAVVGVGTALALEYRSAFKKKTMTQGLNWLVTVAIVISILGVLNFLSEKHPFKYDTTKNKVHTLSDQTAKLIKGLKTPLKATFFGKMGDREQKRALLDNLRDLNPKFEVEYVDPDKEPTRAKQLQIKKYGTLVLNYGTKEQKMDEVTEEKLTNTLIKLLKDKNATLCFITGHGEKSISSNEAEGYQGIKKGLEGQSYDTKEFTLAQEAKIPADCSAIAILGPTKAFFDPEVKAIRDYLAGGGRALIALDVSIKGTETSPELVAVLKDWYIGVGNALIIDPLSKMLGVDAAVPIVATFSKENPIAKEFTAQQNCYFPFTRPLDVIAGAPADLKIQWIAKTTPKSWAETDFKELGAGKVQFTKGADKEGPLTTMMAVEGKLKGSTTATKTRLVVFGTSVFASNNYSRFGANVDLFLNSASWVLEDESLISIRSKEEGPGKVELSQQAGKFIFLLTVILIPLSIAIGGIVMWVIRKKL